MTKSTEFDDKFKIIYIWYFEIRNRSLSDARKIPTTMCSTVIAAEEIIEKYKNI